MAATKQKHELDLSVFPPGSMTEYSTLVCLACTFDIFTTQLGLAPRTAYSEIRRYTGNQRGQARLPGTTTVGEVRYWWLQQIVRLESGLVRLAWAGHKCPF